MKCPGVACDFRLRPAYQSEIPARMSNSGPPAKHEATSPTIVEHMSYSGSGEWSTLVLRHSSQHSQSCRAMPSRAYLCSVEPLSGQSRTFNHRSEFCSCNVERERHQTAIRRCLDLIGREMLGGRQQLGCYVLRRFDVINAIVNAAEHDSF